MISLFNEIKTYIETRYDITRLDLTEKVIIITGLIIQVIIIAFLSFLVLIILSLAVGNYLGKYWDNTGLGFLAVTGFYVLILIIFIVFRKALIIKPLSKILIKLLLNSQREEDDEDEEF
jgi:hypothetical protein